MDKNILIGSNAITSREGFLSACMGLLESGISQLELCSVLLKSGLGEPMAVANATMSRDPLDGPLDDDALTSFLGAVYEAAASGRSERDSLEILLEKERLYSDEVTESKGACFLSYRIVPKPGVRVSAFRRAIPKIEALLKRPVRLAIDGDSLVLETVRPGSVSPDYAAIGEQMPGGLYPIGAGIDDGVVGIPSPDLLIIGEKGCGRSSLLRHVLVSCCRGGDARIAHVCADRRLSIPESLSVSCGNWKGSVCGSYPAASMVHAIRREMIRRQSGVGLGGPGIVLFIDDADEILKKWDLGDSRPAKELKRLFQRALVEIAIHGPLVGIHLVASMSSWMSSEFESVLSYSMQNKAVLKTDERLFRAYGSDKLSSQGDGLLFQQDLTDPMRFRSPYVSAERAEEMMLSVAADAPCLDLDVYC